MNQIKLLLSLKEIKESYDAFFVLNKYGEGTHEEQFEVLQKHFKNDRLSSNALRWIRDNYDCYRIDRQDKSGPFYHLEQKLKKYIKNKAKGERKKMNKYEEILNIIEKRTLIGTMSRDYGKTVDDVLTINDANELIMLEEALEQAKKEHELLELYRILINLKEEYIVSDGILKQQKALDAIRDIIEEINLLVEESEEER